MPKNQAPGTISVSTVRSRAEIVHYLEPLPVLTNAKQHTVIGSPAVDGRPVEKTIIRLNQRSGGIIAIHVISIFVVRESEQKRELTAGRDLEQRAALRVRRALARKLSRAVEISIRSLDQNIRSITFRTVAKLLWRAGKAEQLLNAGSARGR